MYHRTLLYHFLTHYPTLLGRYLHHLYGRYLAVETHIVVKLAPRDGADGELRRVHADSAVMVAENNPSHEGQHADTGGDER